MPEQATTLSDVPQFSESCDVLDELLRAGILGPPSQPGVRGMLADYRVLKQLGEGGMGIVLLALDTAGKLVAVKLVKPSLMNRPEIVALFRREIDTSRKCFEQGYPNVLPVVGHSLHEPTPYLATRYIKRGSLRRRKMPLDADIARHVASEIARAFVALHEHHFVHADLKPENVLIDEQLEVYVSDFGLARDWTRFTELLNATVPVGGTPAYMAPEVVKGATPDKSCDIYGLGVVLYEMLSGRPPYQGLNRDDILRQIRQGPPPLIRSVRPDAPRHLTQIAEWAMARELGDRYATMRDVFDDLERAKRGQRPVGRSSTAAVPERSTTLKRRAVVCGGIVAAMIGAIAPLLLISPAPPSPHPTPNQQPEPKLVQVALTLRTDDAPASDARFDFTQAVDQEFRRRPRVGDSINVDMTLSSAGCMSVTLILPNGNTHHFENTLAPPSNAAPASTRFLAPPDDETGTSKEWRLEEGTGNLVVVCVHEGGPPLENVHELLKDLSNWTEFPPVDRIWVFDGAQWNVRRDVRDAPSAPSGMAALDQVTKLYEERCRILIVPVTAETAQARRTNQFSLQVKNDVNVPVEVAVSGFNVRPRVESLRPGAIWSITVFTEAQSYRLTAKGAKNTASQRIASSDAKRAVVWDRVTVGTIKLR